jgi:hypothetical protein
LSRVTVEFYNGHVADFDNARYCVRGENFLITHENNGKVRVRVGRVHVYGITIATGGHVPTADNTGVGTA